MNNKFPTSVSLNDTWFEWEYGKFKDVLERYHTERDKLDNIEPENAEDLHCSEEYLTQEKYVQQLYEGVLGLKERIDNKLKGGI